MKLQVFLILLVFFAQQSVAQSPVFNYEPAGATEAKPQPYNVTIINDENSGRSTVQLRNNNQVEYLLLSDKFGLESKVQVPINTTVFSLNDNMYLGGVQNNLGSCFIYSVRDKSLNKNKWHMRMEVVDFKNKTVSDKEVMQYSDFESNFELFTDHGTFNMLTVNDKEHLFKVYQMGPDGKMTVKSTPVDLSPFDMKSKLLLQEYFMSSHVFKPNEEADLIAAKDPTKVYVYPDELFFLVGNIYEPPHIWTVNKKTLAISTRKIDMTGFTGYETKKGKPLTVSTMYKDRVYVMNPSKESLQIGIFDFATGKLLKRYDIDNNTPFLEAPVERMTLGRKTREKDLGKDKALFKELSKGSGGIAVETNSDGQLVLTCGVYDKEQRQYSSVSSRPELDSRGGTRTVNSYSTNSYTYIRTASFKLKLDPNSLNIANAGDKRTRLDKINDFLIDISNIAQGTTVFESAGHTYVGYYDTAARVFYIQEIKI